MLFGYRQVDLVDNQQAFVATPEKALLDEAYLQPGGDDPDYLREMRFNYDRLDMDALTFLAAASRSPKLMRTARRVRALATEEREREGEWERL